MDPLSELYRLRNDFVVIGLTGRLGSGCTTVAELLTTKNFEDCSFPLPKSSDFLSNEERKYRIVYNYLHENWSNWKFVLVRPSDIIVSFLFKHELNSIKKYLNDTFPEKDSEVQGVIDYINDDFESLKYFVQKVFDQSSTSSNYRNTLDLDAAYDVFIIDNKLADFSNKLKIKLAELSNKSKPSLFQVFGNNLRKSGNVLNDQNFDPANCYAISEVSNQLIKAIRKNSGKKAWVVIDSIRNSLEALYFKERFSAFYLFGINTENKTRIERLTKLYSQQDAEALDIEYTNLSSEEKFYEQDIKSCIQVADIHLYNPQDEQPGIRYQVLKKQLVRYLSLIKQPGIITPTPEERNMQIAYTAKYNSGCISRQVGAVITDQSFSLKSVGWNNTAEGQTPCLLRNVTDLINDTDSTAFSDHEKGDDVKGILKETYKDFRTGTFNGRNISFCFKEVHNCIDGHKNQVHTRSLHAEENAMLQIAKYGGEGLKNGYLFTTASPCELCSKKAYQLGIKKIFYIDPYPGIAEKQILRSGQDNHKPELVLFNGAIGRAYHQLFEPFMAYKDELKILTKYDYDNAISSINKDKVLDDLRAMKEKIEKRIRSIEDAETDN
ncbi:hypothetical protein DYU11_29795 [Fibrisoma montanum]|uniref:CMP/dCMP-type deaminase domain-containing protein n=1 Tax=Fibrisoma montanum TaxID=2305895 RepID=A0A418LY77_9BACT|nr:hypothetical protein [Fibrisoma montanum]RIV18148.1 hypothetical protein DYU11_29795 [Fibrisoma montanum]